MGPIGPIGPIPAAAAPDPTTSHAPTPRAAPGEAGADPPSTPIWRADAGSPRPPGASHIPDLRRPERIAGYAIIRLIGIGGMGTVYEAMQDAPRRAVALKVLNPGPFPEQTIPRFQREAELLGALRHPGIAQVYEAGLHQAAPDAPGSTDAPGGVVPFFAMELVPGAKPLTSHADARKLSRRQRIELMIQVCDAVHHAHESGVIHRDLKPSNILVDGDGRAKVIDFGIARAVEAPLLPGGSQPIHTDPGTLMGTLQYMSPEQVEGDPRRIDRRTDIYSLGVLLHELVLGRRPYEVTGMPLPKALELIRDREPPRPSRVDPAINEDLEAVIVRALEKDRDHRYPTAAMLRDDLRSVLDDQPVWASPARGFSGLARAARRITRRRAMLAAMVVIVLAALLSITVGAGVLSPLIYRFEQAAPRIAAPAPLPTPSITRARVIGVRDDASLPALYEKLGLDPALLQRPGRLRPLFGKLLSHLAGAAPTAVVFDYDIREGRDDMDTELIAGVKALRKAGSAVVIGSGTAQRTDDGLPPICPALAPLARWGTLGAHPSAGADPLLDLAIGAPGEDAAPSLALEAIAASQPNVLRQPEARCSVRIDSEARLVRLRPWKPSPSVPGERISLGPELSVGYTEIETGKEDIEHGVRTSDAAALLRVPVPPDATLAQATIPIGDVLGMSPADMTAAGLGGIVLIGDTSGESDAFDAPGPNGPRRIPGVYAHLASIETLLAQTVIVRAGTWEEIAACLAAAAAGLLAVLSARGRSRSLLWIGAIAAAALAVAISLLLLRFYRYQLDPFVPALSAMIAAALWLFLKRGLRAAPSTPSEGTEPCPPSAA